MTMPQGWPFQIPLLRLARPYARNAAVPATWKTAQKGSPCATTRGCACAVTYATTIPMITQYANHIARNLGRTGGPGGNTVIIPMGPCLYFSNMAGDFMSFGLQ